MPQPATFTVYNASAGSGKTFTLVKEYLKVILASDDVFTFQKILAITFTNKAAAEMKERVISTLQAIAEGKPNEMAEMIGKELAISPQVLKDRCRQIIVAILQNYAAFHITTIDSFTHKLIKSFAFDLGLSLNFEVSLDTKEMLKEAVDVLISKIGTDKELTDALVDFSIQKISNDASWDIAHDLNDVAQILLNETDRFQFQQIATKELKEFTGLAAALEDSYKKLIAKQQQLGAQALAIIESQGLAFKDFYYSQLPKHFLGLADSPETVKFFDETKLKANIENDVFYSKSLPQPKAAAIDSIKAQLVELYLLSEETHAQVVLLNLTRKTMIPLAVINAIHHELNSIQEEENTVLISAFNQLIFNTIKEQPAPYIYERIGEKFSHYFIDEMQDTSILQWQNLIPLVANALAQQDTSLLLVGDGKQSIYRFRGGEADQFVALGSEVTTVPGIFVNKNVEQLAYNYRSYSEMISFNNGFFKHCASFLERESYRELFLHQSHQEATTKVGGYVSLMFTEQERLKADRDAKFATQVHQTIVEVQKDFDYSEICVLVRKKKLGIVIADYLIAQGIPIISSETVLLKNSPKVGFITYLLQALLDPSDKDALFEVLHFLYDHLEITRSKHDFIQTNIHLGTAVFKSLESEGVFFSTAFYQELSLYEKVEYIIRAFTLVTSSESYLQCFLDEVLQQQAKDGTVAGFLEFWKLKKDSLSITSSTNTNAVQIMTVHKSKGLEFPVVIFPSDEHLYEQINTKVWISELPSDPFGDFETLLVPYTKSLQHISATSAQLYQEEQEQLALDAINILYVALTRAKEQLYIITENKQSKGEEQVHYYSGIYINYLKRLQLWNDEQSEYTFGSKVRKSVKTASSLTSTTQESYRNHTWRDHDVVLLAGASQLWGTHQGEAISFGNLVHEMLSEITTATDVAGVVEKYYTKGVVSSALKNTIQATLNSIISHPDLASYYSNEYTVFNERALVVHQQVYIPDRLLFTQKNEVVIIDYKTGAPNKSHQQQVINYQDALEEMGYTVTKKILIYISESIRIEEI